MASYTLGVDRADMTPMMAPSNAADRMIHFRFRTISQESERVVSIADCEGGGTAAAPVRGTGGAPEPEDK
jgi:hypothetical protein